MASTDRSETEGESASMTSKAYKCEHNPFEAIFDNLSQGDKSASTMRCQFVRGVFAQSKSAVARSLTLVIALVLVVRIMSFSRSLVDRTTDLHSSLLCSCVSIPK